MATPHRRMPTLWSALRYPALVLERLTLDDEETRPVAVTVVDGARRVVLQANEHAGALGVRAGVTLSTARALAPTLLAIEHDPQAVATRLDQLALGAHRYSSRVSLAPSDTILVEVGASLRLFGGLGALLERMRSDAAADRCEIVIGTAPTPTAARLLAHANDERPVRTVAALMAVVSSLPVETLKLEPRALQGLARSGVRSIGQLRGIPPASLSRRFGHPLVDTLYRLEGRLPDPQVPVIVPAAFEEVIELPLEAASTAALGFALRRLIGTFAGFLRARDLGVGAVVIELRHRRRAPTRLTLRFTEPTGDAAHVSRTAEARLARTVLAEPVTHLGLVSETLAPIERSAATLLDTDGSRQASRAEVLDALVARLGSDRVYTIATREEHRPEASDARTPAHEMTPMPSPWPARPLWLFDRPEPARTSLELVSDVERIETAWWERALDARRDYFIARDEAGAHYWVFRHRGDATSPVWVHGVFA